MLILAIYYTLADIVLLIQCVYYRVYARKLQSEVQETNGNHRATTSRPGTAGTDADPTEESPLLSRTVSDYYYGEERRSSLSILAEHAHHLSPANPLHSLPPSRPDSPYKNHTNGEYPTVDNHSTPNRDGTARETSKNGQKSIWKAIMRDGIAVSLVIIAGVAGYYLTPSKGASKDPHIPEHRAPLTFSFYGQIFGYLCAVLYLGSRIPQIVLNYQRKSCEGVAFLFFLFACLGNITYVISIMAYNPGKVEDGEGYWRYIGVNASWLLGSVGTLALDFVIFVQFFLYQNNEDWEGDDNAIMSDEDDETIRPSP
ncbi:hypothetical protein ABW20_dc0104060 [Dactylellina cionopaga]|nr:hypothetical protein ABW20_dc0104060 [Dactylellina cionopaga]